MAEKTVPGDRKMDGSPSPDVEDGPPNCSPGGGKNDGTTTAVLLQEECGSAVVLEAASSLGRRRRRRREYIDAFDDRELTATIGVRTSEQPPKYSGGGGEERWKKRGCPAQIWRGGEGEQGLQAGEGGKTRWKEDIYLDIPWLRSCRRRGGRERRQWRRRRRIRGNSDH